MQANRDLSEAEWLATQPPDIVDAFFGSLTDEAIEELPYTWDFWARPKQKAPTAPWQYWLLLAGRGFGKTRTICEWAIEQALERPGSRGAIVGATAADVRDVLIEGASGILAISSPNFMANYEPSKRRITWPNGSQAILYSAEEPNRLRGPQHHWAIADELAAWRKLETWDMLMFGMRLGDNPQTAIATTPRPLTIIKELMDDPDCYTTIGTTYENKANLATSFFNNIISKYEGTRLGRQELEAQLLWEVPGALWRMGKKGEKGTIENSRKRYLPELVKIVVGVDPPGTTAECGIVVAGIDKDGNGYVIEDYSLAGTPAEWSTAVVKAYNKHKADAIVAEANQGGAMVEHTIRTAEGGENLPIKLVWASRGKRTRAEPISNLYERGKVFHHGAFAKLETQMTIWVPGEASPDRLDALVWSLTELMVPKEEEVEPLGILAFSSAKSKW